MAGERRIVNRRAAPRRENAPIRRYVRPNSWPDMLIAAAAATWCMAVFFLLASFLSGNVAAGEAGRMIERLFAAALAVAGLFLFSLGVSILGDDRVHPDHYRGPLLIGAVAGALESLLFVVPLPELLWAPPLLLLFALRPLRNLLGSTSGTRGRR
jgi:hypothetical protein